MLRFDPLFQGVTFPWHLRFLLLIPGDQLHKLMAQDPSLLTLLNVLYFDRLRIMSLILVLVTLLKFPVFPLARISDSLTQNRNKCWHPKKLFTVSSCRMPSFPSLPTRAHQNLSTWTNFARYHFSPRLTLNSSCIESSIAYVCIFKLSKWVGGRQWKIVPFQQK